MRDGAAAINDQSAPIDAPPPCNKIAPFSPASGAKAASGERHSRSSCFIDAQMRDLAGAGKSP